MATIADLLRTAVAHHNAGRLSAAEKLYCQVLELRPNHPDALHLLGVVASQSGRLSRAAELMGRAIDQKPNFAEAHSNLGTAYKAQGKLDEAVASYERALVCRPDFAGALANLGHVLKLQGELGAAVERFQQAIAANPQYAGAYSGLGLALAAQGRLAEAASSCRRAVQIQPSSAEGHSNLGGVLQRQGKLSAAMTSYERALALNPRYAEAHYNLGCTLKARGQLQEAVASCRRAIENRPDYAEAHNSLGNALQIQGNLEEATASFRRAIEAKPDYVDALANFAQSRRFSPTDRDTIARFRELLARGTLDDVAGGRLHFALGKILDDCGDWDEAFHHFQRGNELSGCEYDPEQTTRLFDAIMAVCTRPVLERGATIGHQSDLPVLIVGMPRCGTTLAEQILAGHPAVHGAGEVTEIEAIVQELGTGRGAGRCFPDCLPHLDPATVAQLADRYLKRLAGLGGHARRVTDKLPANFINLGLIALMLPRARVIHCRRHPLDVCVSCYFQNFRSAQRLAYTFDLRALGLYHQQYSRLMQHWREVLPLQMLEVDYESLVTNQEQVSRTLVEFCGLDWRPECLEFHRARREVHTSSNWQVRQPVYTSSVGRWKHYEKHLGPLREALAGSAER